MSDLVVWESKHFPEFKLMEDELFYLRAHFPEIDHFYPLCIEAERWLSANPERAPTSNWKRFFRNWVRKHIQFNEERKKKESLLKQELGAERVRAGGMRQIAQVIQEASKKNELPGVRTNKI